MKFLKRAIDCEAFEMYHYYTHIAKREGKVTSMGILKRFFVTELVNLTHRHSDTIKNPAGEENRHNHRATDQGVPGESGEGEKRGEW